MNTKKVVAAIIIENGKVFATQRGYGEYKGWWEFPGGKVEPGEDPKAALAREIREEMDTEIEVGELFDTVEYDYLDFHLSMDCFLCSVKFGKLTLLEHQDAKWLSADEIYDVEWLTADRGLVSKIQEYLNRDGDFNEIYSFG